MEFKNPKQILIPDDWRELYQKLRPFKYKNKLIKKELQNDKNLTPKKLASVSYLWHENEVEIKDNYDQNFLNGVYDQSEIKVYSYHDYGGYYGFFRPDFLEIIKIAQDIIRNADIVYVTTDTCDSQGNFSVHFTDCFNEKLDMHTACTRLFPVYFPMVVF